MLGVHGAGLEAAASAACLRAISVALDERTRRASSSFEGRERKERTGNLSQKEE